MDRKDWKFKKVSDKMKNHGAEHPKGLKTLRYLCSGRLRQAVTAHSLHPQSRTVRMKAARINNN